jgi:acyl carrier protein
MSEVQVDAIAARVRTFLIEKFPLARKRNLQNGDSLIDSGIVDSLGILDLVAFLESEFGLQIADDELLPENFQTIDCIVTLIRTKTS